MIVSNGRKMFGNGSILKAGIATGEVKWNDGTAITTSVTQTNMYLDEARTANNQRGVHMFLGVGTTAPTEADYWLDETEVDGTDINSIITCSSASVSGTGGNPVYTFTFYNNSSTDSFTVTELCICDLPYNAGGAGERFIMLARKVLATPRTIAPHETVVFAYEIDF